jgi:hypothetical protein
MGGAVEGAALGQVRLTELIADLCTDGTGQFPTPICGNRRLPFGRWRPANKQARQDGKRLNAEEAIFANIMNQRRLVQQALSLAKQPAAAREATDAGRAISGLG